jgi:hypothetical protein
LLDPVAGSVKLVWNDAILDAASEALAVAVLIDTTKPGWPDAASSAVDVALIARRKEAMLDAKSDAVVGSAMD